MGAHILHHGCEHGVTPQLIPATAIWHAEQTPIGLFNIGQ